MFEALFKYPLGKYLSGRLGLSGGLRVELALLAVVVAAVAAVGFYRRGPVRLGRRARAGLSALRGLALGLLAAILFEPILRTARPQEREAFLAVLVDDSRSMRIEDVDVQAGGAGPAGAGRRISRLARARQVLGADADEGLLRRLGGICPVQMFGFSSTARPVASATDLRATGERTDLSAALRQVDGELRGVPLAGIVVLTDGAVNAGGPPRDVAEELAARNRPVYCVGLGRADPPRDYEVLAVRAPKRIRQDSSVELFANIRTSGFDGPFDVVLRRGDEVLQRLQGVVGEPSRQVHRVRLAFRPEQKGTFTYTVEVPPHAEEIIRDNNRCDFIAEVMDDRLPVLYLEGSPREEYRFLRRALLRDKDFRIASILRLDGPRKFVLQGAEPEDGLADGYPKTLEHLGRFQAVIFGDIDAGFLTPQQLQITEDFVRRRGGGFLMLGGVNSFNLGRYHGTPIDNMLPVILPGPEVAYRPSEFRIQVTRAGEEHPIMRQSPNVVVNRGIWAKAPTLVGCNPIQKVRPLAQVLAVEPALGAPVLAVQDYGAGRTAALATGGSWRWRMAVPLEDELHEKFWKQLIRWLAVGAKAKLRVELDKDIYSLGEPVTLRAVVLDRSFQPVNDAAVEVQITDPFGEKLKDAGGQPCPMRVNWTLSEPGVYQAQYEPPDAGNYAIAATATLAGEPPLTAETTFLVGETLDEYSDAGQKVALLQEIARISGGRYFQPAEAGELDRRGFLRAAAAGAAAMAGLPLLAGPARILAAGGSGSSREGPAASEGDVDGPKTVKTGTFFLPRLMFHVKDETGDQWNIYPVGDVILRKRLRQLTNVNASQDPVVVRLADLDDACRYPFVFATSEGYFDLPRNEEANLKEFLMRGGFVYAADCVLGKTGDRFFKDYLKMINRLFEREGLEMRRVENDHEVHHSYFDFPDGPPFLQGVNHGPHALFEKGTGRIMTYLTPGDLHCGWTSMWCSKDMAEACLRMGINIIIYYLMH